VPGQSATERPDWIHEVKHDGFRIMALRDNADARLPKTAWY
jgi:ATP-dependent DNA ligase